MKDVQRSFRLPAKLDKDLAAKAEAVDRSASWVICRSLELALYDKRVATGLAVMRGTGKKG